MYFPKSLLTVGATFALALTASLAKAEYSETFGQYTVHYNAFSSDTIQPNVAKVYNITRSKNRGLLTISVVKNSESKMGSPVVATVSAEATNLTGQLKTIDIQEIKEGNSVYYISQFPVADKEVLDFTVQVQPEHQGDPQTIKFRQQFFTQ